MTHQRPPFINDQDLWLLDDYDQVPNPKLFLEPQLFRQIKLRRQREDARNESRRGLPEDDAVPAQSPDDPLAAWVKHWQAIDKQELFFRRDLRRLCLVTPGGIGKTTTLRWIACASAERQLRDGRPEPHDGDQRPRREVAMFVELRELPKNAENYLGTEKRPGTLVRLFRKPLDSRTQRSYTPRTVYPLLKRLIQRGELTLLVDGLDQTRSPRTGCGNPVVAALAEFLQAEGRDCRVILAGRPHALDQYWTDLFEDRPWRFAQLGEFTKAQQKRFLGDERYHQLVQLDAEELAVPRMLEAVCELPSDVLRTLHTASDVFAAVIERLFEKDQPVDHARHLTFDQTLELLSAIAFQMIREDKFDGVARGEYGRFVERLFQQQGDRKKTTCPRKVGGTLRVPSPHTECAVHSFLPLAQDCHLKWRSKAELRRRLNALGKTNSVLQYCFLETHQQLTDIYFRNTTLLEFFAGLWLAKFAPDEDSQWMGERPFLPLREGFDSENRYRVWRFAAEMPEAFRAEQSWTASLRPLYLPGDGTPEGTRRANEILYRSWDTMLAYAQRDPDARDAVREFQSEFTHTILAGHRGAEARRIAEAFLSEFRPIPPDYESDNDLKFRMGSTPEQQQEYRPWLDETRREASVPAPFEMACYPVTNELYELYDPGHERWFRSRVKDPAELDKHPVVVVSWYDAMMFCRWLNPPRFGQDGCCEPTPDRGIRFEPSRDQPWDHADCVYYLPHEIEWEFACRAGTETIWYFGSHEKDLGAHGWYSGNSAGRTWPVGQKKHNPWRLFDLYGPVWQWCRNRAAADPTKTWDAGPPASARVLRGGSWLNQPDNVRSGVRYHYRPTDVYDRIGFRVARALPRKS